MKTKILVIVASLLVLLVPPIASAESVPAWVKNNAGWWADGTITETEFVQGIEFLVREGVIEVPPTKTSAEKSQGIPEWIKNNAAWWSNGEIDDDTFLQGIQYMIKTGILSINTESLSEKIASINKPQIEKLQTQLEQCQEIKKAYERLECEKSVKHEIKVLELKEISTKFNVGPAIFYFPGPQLEITGSGSAHLTIDMLVENTGSENLQLMCSGPSVCNYDVWNGDKSFKYSSTDFTSGLLVIKPGEAKTFNIFFGPNIGYGGTEFVYDPRNEYTFRVNEPWGSTSIPLNLG